MLAFAIGSSLYHGVFCLSGFAVGPGPMRQGVLEHRAGYPTASKTASASDRRHTPERYSANSASVFTATNGVERITGQERKAIAKEDVGFTALAMPGPGSPGSTAVVVGLSSTLQQAPRDQ